MGRLNTFRRTKRSALIEDHYSPVETTRQPARHLSGGTYSPSRLETGEKERETGWFSICCGRWFLRRFVPSKKLLLHVLLAEGKEGLALNRVRERSMMTMQLITVKPTHSFGSRVECVHGPAQPTCLRTENRCMVIPWEVDPSVI